MIDKNAKGSYSPDLLKDKTEFQLSDIYVLTQRGTDQPFHD
jgi:hypothetical protein